MADQLGLDVRGGGFDCECGDPYDAREYTDDAGVIRARFYRPDRATERDRCRSCGANLHRLHAERTHGLVDCPRCSGSGVDDRTFPNRKVRCYACRGRKQMDPFTADGYRRELTNHPIPQEEQHGDRERATI